MVADGRRTDSRVRIRTTALQLFTEQGYEQTTLTDIATRLGMTRPAVLHHYASKEDLLTSSYAALCTELAAITRTRSRTGALERFADLVGSELGTALVCAQVNEHALRGLPHAAELSDALDRLMRRLAPRRGPGGRIRGRLAVAALVMAEARATELGGRRDDRRREALRTARELVGG